MASMNTEQTLADLNRRFDEDEQAAEAAAGRVARNRVLQVRLSDAELAELERAAESRGLPSSTVAREAILRLLNPEAARSAEATRLIEHFTQFVSEFVPGSDEPKPEPRPTRITKANFTRTPRRKHC
jgi:hypothetical protein